MSTYSPSLRIELITTGDQAGTWGVTTNTNLGTLIESAVAGYTSVSITSANQALTALNGVADQSRNMTIALTTTTTAAFNVYAPPAEKTYVIQNASLYTATIYNSTVLGNTTAAGAGVSVPAGRTVTMWSDGTNFYFQNDHLSSLTLATDLAIADGGTGASTAANARTNLGLGTIATQNANSVSITGGSITGITDLAVADGGTGASTAADARTNLDVPSRAGSGASGTWAINVSGNATTATTVSTTVASGATGTTQAFGTSNTTIATTAFVQAALQALHPVGSIYINATNATNPGTLLGFGTWTAFGAGRVPVGFDAGNPLFDTAEETGGSANAIVVSHTHTGTTAGAGAHTHTMNASSEVSNSQSDRVGDNGTFAAGVKSFGMSNPGDHVHTFTTDSSGSSGTNANYQPYITVYMWKRTA